MSGLPSVEELLANERFQDFQIPIDGEGSGNGRKIIAKYKLYSGDRITQSVDSEGIQHVYIPDREGRPGNGFYRFYWKAVDTDGNNSLDELRVYWGINAIKNSRGFILSKVDIYRNRRYFESGVTWFNIVPIEERDVAVNIGDIWRKYNLE